MSIYIKGMEMPANCNKCPFLDYEEGFCFASGIKGESGWYEYILCPGSNKDGRHEDCPLVPVPDHGRTIDADVLFKEIGMDVRFGILEAMYIQGIIHNAPTIIPSDKEK